MQVFFVKNVNFFCFKVAALQAFILGQIPLRKNFFKTACGVADFYSWSNKFTKFFLNLGFPLGAISNKAFHAFNFGQINLQFFFKT